MNKLDTWGSYPVWVRCNQPKNLSILYHCCLFQTSTSKSGLPEENKIPLAPIVLGNRSFSAPKTENYFHYQTLWLCENMIVFCAFKNSNSLIKPGHCKIVWSKQSLIVLRSYQVCAYSSLSASSPFSLSLSRLPAKPHSQGEFGLKQKRNTLVLSFRAITASCFSWRALLSSFFSCFFGLFPSCYSNPFCLSHHQMKCCGWTGPGNWSDNNLIKNSTLNLYPCSCRNETVPGTEIKEVGLCEHLSTDLPIHETVHVQVCLIIAEEISW